LLSLLFGNALFRVSAHGLEGMAMAQDADKRDHEPAARTMRAGRVRAGL
jgi:hypothetical protein